MCEKLRKRCCFAGHSTLYSGKNELLKRLRATAVDLIEHHGVTQFWVGHYGSFDGCAAVTIRDLKKDYPYIELDLIIPYLTKEINEYSREYNEKYDHILMADVPENTPHQFYIVKTNEYMVNESDFIICYVQFPWGGAARTMRYAKTKKHITVINLAE